MQLTSYQTRAAKRDGLNRLIEKATDGEYQRRMRALRAENIRRTEAATG